MAINNIETGNLCHLYRCLSCNFQALRMEAEDQQPLSKCISGSFPVRELGTIHEPLIALVSATVTTAYTLHHEQRRVRNPSNHIQIMANVDCRWYQMRSMWVTSSIREILVTFWIRLHFRYSHHVSFWAARFLRSRIDVRDAIHASRLFLYSPFLRPLP